MLSAAELASIRAASAEWFPNTAYVVRNAGTQNVIGGHIQAWGTIGTIGCRVREYGQGRATDGAAQSVLATDQEWEIVVAFDADVAVEDRVEVDGSTYHVTGDSSGRSDMPDRRLRAVRRT